MITLGIIADTHIPDRMPRLHAGVLPAFRRAGVRAILHAGDVCVPRVLRELETVAPVFAVQGNRDWISLRHLPTSLILEFDGVKIGLAHGHGGLWRYLLEKLHNSLYGLKEEKYVDYMLSFFPGVDVIVFGHVHRIVNQRLSGKLVFDPGSACCAEDIEKGPTVGLLNIYEQGQVDAEVVYLNIASVGF